MLVLRLDLRQKAIASLGNCLNIARRRGRVAEYVSQFGYGCIQSMIKIDECIFGPQALPKLFTGHNIVGPFQQSHQHLKGLHLQLQPGSLTAQFSSTKIGFVIVKPVFKNGRHAQLEAIS